MRLSYTYIFDAQPLESAVPLLLQYSLYFDYIDFLTLIFTDRVFFLLFATSVTNTVRRRFKMYNICQIKCSEVLSGYECGNARNQATKCTRVYRFPIGYVLNVADSTSIQPRILE